MISPFKHNLLRTVSASVGLMMFCQGTLRVAPKRDMCWANEQALAILTALFSGHLSGRSAISMI
jgi:hypothetical protein